MTRSIVLIAALMLSTVACTTRQTITLPAAGAPSTALPGEVRVVRTDGTAYALHDARIDIDSVVGTDAAGTRVAIATKDVRTIDERRISALRTAGLVGVTAVGIVAALVIYAIASIPALY